MRFKKNLQLEAELYILSNVNTMHRNENYYHSRISTHKQSSNITPAFLKHYIPDMENTIMKVQLKNKERNVTVIEL